MTEKMTDGMLKSTIKRINRQIEREIKENGKADPRQYQLLEKYAEAYIIRFGELPE